MCGIVGYSGERQAGEILISGLRKLEYRGYDSCGIAVIDNGNIFIEKSSGRIDNLVDKIREKKMPDGFVGIAHTRWATHGAPTDENAHPHISNNRKFAVVHNGIIENYISIKDELIRKGYTFQSDTDTEVIAHLCETYYKGDMRLTLLKVASRLEGSYALGIICSDFPEKIYLAKESSPLIIGVGAGECYFASDVTALVAHTRSMIYLEDGEFAEISGSDINLFNLKGEEIKKEIAKINWDIKAAEKGGYEHFMLKEIYEQPHAIQSAISPRIKNNEIILELKNLSDNELKRIKKIVIVACGSAYYAGCAGKYAIEGFAKIPVSVELASEFRYGEPVVDSSTLLIALSQSGETADTIASLREGKRLGAKSLAVVNVVGSTVASLADDTLYTNAGPEIAVATTKGYTTQVVTLYVFALYLAKLLDKMGAEKYLSLISEIKDIPMLTEKALYMNSHISVLAEKYSRRKSVFFIGRNTDYATALEGALKLKEISYIHAEAYAAGELKHGTIALIEEKTPVVAICVNESVMDKTVNNVIELKARGAKILSLTRDGEEKMASISDDIMLIPSISSLFAPVLEIIPLQLLAYYTAKLRGCDIDKPKNLAKSVTVE